MKSEYQPLEKLVQELEDIMQQQGSSIKKEPSHYIKVDNNYFHPINFQNSILTLLPSNHDLKSSLKNYFESPIALPTSSYPRKYLELEKRRCCEKITDTLSSMDSALLEFLSKSNNDFIRELVNRELISRTQQILIAIARVPDDEQFIAEHSAIDLEILSDPDYLSYMKLHNHNFKILGESVESL